MGKKNNRNDTTINTNIVDETTKSRKHYDADFKKQVIEICNSGTYASAAECARSYGINENTLHNWIHKSKNPVVVSVDPEHVKLKKENARLKMELDILKKAAIYFANHAR
jgi:transposase